MIIGAYLGVSIIVGTITFFLLRRSLRVHLAPELAQKRINSFLWTSTVFVLVGLVTFVLFSMWTGIFTLGETGNFSVPASYTSEGLVGWLIMLWMVLGILSPILVAIRASKQGS